MTRNHPTDKMRYYIEGNNYTFPEGGTPGFIVLLPSNSTNPDESRVTRIADILDFNNKSIVRNNIVTNPHRGWVFVVNGVDAESGSNTYFRISGNTYTGTLSIRPTAVYIDDTINVLLDATPNVMTGWDVFYETGLNPVTIIDTSGNDFNIGNETNPVFVIPNCCKYHRR
jgi:hypothetical protein